MAEFSYPFDAGTGAILTEDDWSDMAKNWQDDGVITNLLNSVDLTVTTLSAPNAVVIKTGTALIQGFMYRSTADLTLAFSTNATGNPRRDRVVLRLDRNTNTIAAVVKEGTPAASPAIPALNTTYPIYEIPLGWFQVAAGGSTVAPGVITTDRQVTSRYVRVSEATSGLPQGSVVYRPTTNKFYTVGSSGVPVEIGGTAAFITATNGSKPIGANAFNGLTVLETNTRRLTSYSTTAADYEPPVGVGFLRYKQTDSPTQAGASSIIDPNVWVTPQLEGEYRASGEIFYSSNTAAATAIFSLSGNANNIPKGVFRHITGASTSVVHTTSDAFSSGCTIGTPVANTVYAASYDFYIFVGPSGTKTDIAIRTSARSGSSVWTVCYGSYIRLEKVLS